MAGPDSFMPLFIGDYLADTAHLDTTQHGAYLLLLFYYWRKGGPVVDDPMVLATIARLTPKRWALIGGVVRAFFMPATIDAVPMLVHTRVEKELLQARGKYESRKAASERANEAKALALARLSQNRDGDRNGNLDGDPGGDRNGPTTTTTTIASNEAESIPAVPASRPPKKSLNGHKAEFAEFYDSFPRHVAPRAAEKAYVSALKRASPEIILAGAKRYALSRAREDHKFTQHPATWLNADCWLNEDGKTISVDPGKAADDKDKADQFLRRGKYAETSN